MNHLLLILLSLALLRCGADSLPKYSLLTNLRVLALQADLPEAHPGDNIIVTPYLSDPNGGGRAITFSAEVCVDPGVVYGADPTCVGNPTRVVLNNQSPAAALPGRWTGDTTPVNFAIPALILIGRSAVEKYNGVSYLFTYQVFAGAETVRSFKKILVVDPTKVTLNTNPTTAGPIDILFNGVASAGVAVLPSAEQSLGLSYNAADQEAYAVQSPDGSLQGQVEELTTTWFITEGEVLTYRTVGAEETTWAPSSAPFALAVAVIAVVRDGRGGVGFFKKEF
jgi:hypothetical protein